MAEKWIQKAIKKPGALRKQLRVPEGKKIPVSKLRSAAKKGGKLGQRARLAMTLRKFDAGGVVPEDGVYHLQKGETVIPAPAACGYWTSTGTGEIVFKTVKEKT